MKYVLLCEDKPGSTDLRQSTRGDHLAYIAEHTVLYAGPMLADDEATPIGSMIVVEAPSRAAADAIAANDPYQLAGLFRQVTIHPFRQVVPV